VKTEIVTKDLGLENQQKIYKSEALVTKVLFIVFIVASGFTFFSELFQVYGVTYLAFGKSESWRTVLSLASGLLGAIISYFALRASHLYEGKK
jgi:hypothetical protein